LMRTTGVRPMVCEMSSYNMEAVSYSRARSLRDSAAFPVASGPRREHDIEPK
jgi:hypothetical protein